jgi:4a-hydroxytetrahydrobiopterin dehydratase
MSISAELTAKNCVPCEGGVPPVAKAEAERLLSGLPGWTLTADGKGIRRQWKCKDFLAAIRFFDQVAELAEREGHHPDLHLTGYRIAAVEMTTHAIGGLSENDFIMAAKIDQVPVDAKK